MKEEILRRNSKQRNIILEELKMVKTHPTADSVFKMARRSLPSVSFGTVYRNLNFLRDQGKILELACGRYSCRYDGNIQNHYHFSCLRCKNIFDIYEPIIKDLDKKISKKSGFRIKYHKIDFYGYCQDCRNKLK